MNSRNRGWALMDIMVTISLVAVGLTMAAVLLSRSMTLTDRAAREDRTVRGFEQMQTMLHRDLFSGGSPEISDSTIVVDKVTWRIEPGRVVREQNGTSRIFETADARLRFGRAGYGAVLIVESPAHEPKRLPLVSQTAWAKESLR